MEWGDRRLHVSGCLCNPDVNQRPHACISGASLWVRGPLLRWWRVTMFKSIHKAKAWLEVCDTFQEAGEALGLETWVGGLPAEGGGWRTVADAPWA